MDTSKIVTVWDAATRKDMHAHGWHCVETHVSHVRDTYGSAYFMYPPEPTLVERLRELADLYMPSSCIAEVCTEAADELERLGKLETAVRVASRVNANACGKIPAYINRDAWLAVIAILDESCGS